MSTLANFRTSISYEFGLTNTASSTDQVEIDRRVNEGVVDVLVKTKCKVSKGTMTLTVSEGDYTLPTGILQIDEITTTSSSTTYPLERVTAAEILQRRQTNTSTSSPVTLYATQGSNLLMVYPTPSAADTVSILYVPRPTALSGVSDTPSDIPSEWHYLVEDYAKWKIASATDDQTSGQGMRYRDDYLMGLVALRKSLRGKGGRRLPRIKVGRSAYMPHDRSADWKY